jgi:hypothetical protein
MREETERLVKEAMERKTVAVKQGKTRIDAICGKCGAPNRVSAAPGEVRVAYTSRDAETNKRRCDAIWLPVLSQFLSRRTFSCAGLAASA